MKKQVSMMIYFCLLILMFMGSDKNVYATEAKEKITITIDASDDNSSLLYAIDSSEPDAFGESNTFIIEEGTSHIIYVKDAAGNIISQTYEHKPSNPQTSEEEELNIELGVSESNKSSSSKNNYNNSNGNMNYEYLTDTKIDNSDANVISKITTDGSDLAEKVFYTITTQEGEEFYLVIEQGSSNKVHLLNTVTLDDLAALADGGGKLNNSSEQPDNLLEALKGTAEESKETDTEKEMDSKQPSSQRNNLYIYILVGLGLGAYYYFNIYKNKKNKSMDDIDARDLDEFVMEEDEEEDEYIDFDEKEKQELLDQLLNGEEDEENEEEVIKESMEYEFTGEEQVQEPLENAAGEEQDISVDEFVEEYATSHEVETQKDEEEGGGDAPEFLQEDTDEEFDEELDGEEES